MLYSKSFGYAVRGILFIAVNSKDNPRVRVDEMARQLAVPRHFLAKIMKKLVQNGILSSTKGPYGGISLNESTLSVSLFGLMTIINGTTQFDTCILRLGQCNPENPCPLHYKIAAYDLALNQVLTTTTIGELLNESRDDYLKSICGN